MNKRQSKKNRNKLSKNELLVLDLYHACTNCDFWLHRADLAHSTDFVNKVSAPTYNEKTRSFWSRKGKIDANAILKVSEDE